MDMADKLSFRHQQQQQHKPIKSGDAQSLQQLQA
jgi:hypothetical protein